MKERRKKGKIRLYVLAAFVTFILPFPFKEFGFYPIISVKSLSRINM